MALQSVVPITTDPTLQIIRGSENPGGLTLRIRDSSGLPASEVMLTPSEADQLVLTALALTTPAGGTFTGYDSAESAVRSWQREAAEIRHLDDETAARNRILREAGIGIAYDHATQGARALVDLVIAERRKAEQK